MPLRQFHRPACKRGNSLHHALLLQKGTKAGIAMVIEGTGTQGKARQGIAPGTPIQLIVEMFPPLADKHPPTFLGVVDKILHAVFQGIDKAAETRITKGLVVRHENELVIGRHTIFFNEKGPAGQPFDGHLIQLEIPEGPDNRIDLPGQQGGGERKVDVDKFNITQLQTDSGQHRLEQRGFKAADRIADGFPLQVGQGPDSAVGADEKTVEGGGD